MHADYRSYKLSKPAQYYKFLTYSTQRWVQRMSRCWTSGSRRGRHRYWSASKHLRTDSTISSRTAPSWSCKSQENNLSLQLLIHLQGWCGAEISILRKLATPKILYRYLDKITRTPRAARRRGHVLRMCNNADKYNLMIACTYWPCLGLDYSGPVQSSAYEWREQKTTW